MREAVWIHIYTSNELNFISQNHHYPRQDEMFPAVFSAITFVCGWNELCTVDNQPAGCGVWPDTRQLEALCHQDTAAVGLVLKCLILYSELYCSYIHTHTHLMAVWAGWASTRKVKPIWILLKQETVSGNGISWAVCKSAFHSRHTTMPAPHYSVFYRPDALAAAQPTASKCWRQWEMKFSEGIAVNNVIICLLSCQMLLTILACLLAPRCC